VRIEVPSGLALEALQASKNQKSDAEPELPAAPGTAQATGPAAPAPATAKAEAATPQALAEQRAAQYQEIADQMGEAMARRLMAQIERGQWKMQLRMQPAALGRIDVELNMHKSGLDATFSADNAVTRELMAQGSARLRDTLTQSGTTVASVVVNGDSGRQSGGNSTPGRKSKDEQSDNSKKSAAAAVATVAAKAPVDQGDGLNLLA
jgi:flagellar hook-length control protein FliK